MRTNEHNVYKLLKKIPKGKVTTYGEIARKLNLNPRYVG
ncbi:MAG: MGMT family protein, partial [Candidatus Parvarchaeum sp.]